MPQMPTRATLAALLLAAFPAAAQPSAPVQLRFAGYAAGMELFSIQAELAITPESYRVQVSYALTGVVGALFHAASSTRVDGRFQDGRPVPRELFSTGHVRGQPRVTQIDWRDGNPLVLQLVPPVEKDRDPVPAAEQAHTIDALSAMAALVRTVDATGRCEGRSTTFDGRRLTELTASTAGEEVLPQTGRSSFQGPALRCDIEGRLLAGFQHDSGEAMTREPMRGSAWFAPLTPGGLAVPVRIRFENRRFGDATIYLAQPPQTEAAAPPR